MVCMSVLSAVYLFVQCVFTFGSAEDGGPAWNYDDVDDWKEDFPLCGGKFQSPIALNRPTFTDKNLKWSIGGYDQIDHWKISHVGNNVNLTPIREDQKRLRVRGGRLHGDYCMSSIHFHWGRTNDEGSEHTIRGMSFPLEMHIVNYRCVYENINEALDHQGDHDSLAVLGFMLSDDRLLYETEFSKLVKDIVDFVATDPSYGSSTVQSTRFNLEDFIWESLSGNFYSYGGSLTTPPCNENVLWTVFETPIWVNDDMISTFREAMTKTTGQPISFRPPQPKFYREISYAIV